MKESKKEYTDWKDCKQEIKIARDEKPRKRVDKKMRKRLRD